jgi:hypothetical protein
MKRLILVLFVLVSSTALFAAPVDFKDFQPGFDDFVQDLANGLSLNASTGLSWSQAYIGQFPHFGVGVTVGATTIPAKAVSTMADALGISLPSDFSYAEKFGVPVPAYTLEARLGGFVLPFDMGVKLGVIPPDTKFGADVTADYILAGVDVRYALLKDEGPLPAISIGVGYNYMKGSVGVSGILGSDIQIAQVYDEFAVPHDLSLTDPSLQMDWSTNVIEAKLQVSKRLLILTPYLGAAASFSFGSDVSGAVTSDLVYDGGTTITQAQIDSIVQYYEALGETPPDLSAKGITTTASSKGGMSYRVFGGVSFDLLILSLDLGASYEFLSGALGGSLNVRIAL